MNKFYDLVERVFILRSKMGQAYAYYTKGILDGMFLIKQEAIRKGYKGQIGHAPSHTWEDWLVLWEGLIRELERAVLNE